MPGLLLLLIAIAARHACAFTLITFDVDGTLVRGGGPTGKSAEVGAHSRSYGIAVGKILGNGTPTLSVAQSLPGHEYHGSTDGLILLRLARATLGVSASVSAPRLDELMRSMYEYIEGLDDSEIAEGIEPLPGVIEKLGILALMKDKVACGLVTGNVEGIARRKMRAVGILSTGALAPPSKEQQMRSWPGSDHIGFLGGFGSDYCSGNIDDPSRNHLDRAEQIKIATNRCKDLYPEKKITRVVHVGDAPADVLAAKAFSEMADGEFCVGMVAVATGRYPADQLRELAGDSVRERWEPIVLDDGIEDPDFIKACGVL